MNTTMQGLMVDILNDACPSNVLDDGYNEYRIELHCVVYVIEAKPTVRDHTGLTLYYNVRALRVEPN